MEKRKLGLNGPEVSALGLGCFGMSHSYGRRSEKESIATIQRALDLGCNVLDTADVYGAGENEILVGKAIAVRREQLVLATKFGFIWDERGVVVARDASPQHGHEACDASLRRLRTDFIDLYYLHRVDPQIPVEETVGAMARLVAEGKVRHLGLCEASPATIQRAASVHPIAALQSEYSLWTRDPERDVIPLCRSLGIGFVSFCPLGRGFFAGGAKLEDLDESDFRKAQPRFERENFARNLKALDALKNLARRKGCTIAQLALGWVLSQGEHVTAIPGTTRVKHLEENLAALDVKLTPPEMREIDDIAPSGSFAGARYSDTSLFKPDD
jgi:aryl-alcohol dehydrogenase-like predicted oxidoreductase